MSISRMCKVFILSLTLISFSAFSMQMERTFPVGVKRGKMSTTALAELVIDGKLRHITPGMRIWSDNNLFVTIGSLDVRNIIINYTQNEFGEIEKIWILTAEEASVPIPKAKK